MIGIKRSIGIFSIVCFSAAAFSISGCGEGRQAEVADHGHAGPSRGEDGHAETVRLGEAGDSHGASHDDMTDKHDDGDGHDQGTISVTMNEAEIGEGGIELMTAVPGRISRTVDLPGEITANGERLIKIVPRAPGIIREVRADLGDLVVQGQILAVTESRDLADLKAEFAASVRRRELARVVFERERRLFERKISSEQEYLDAKQALAEAEIGSRSNEQKLLSMGFSKTELESIPSHEQAPYTRYEISAPFEGTVIEKRIAPGEAVGGETELFVIADLRDVWLDIKVFERDLGSVRKGQKVRVISADRNVETEGTISYVSPVLDTSTRTALARAVIANPSGLLRPGTFVRARVELGAFEAVVAVAKEAIQTLDDITVVFVRTADGFEAHPVTVGATDAKLAEITSGLSAGQIYAGPGSFSIKAKYVTSGLDSHAGHGH